MSVKSMDNGGKGFFISPLSPERAKLAGETKSLELEVVDFKSALGLCQFSYRSRPPSNNPICAYLEMR